jgi:hypothetical protein
MVGGRAGFDRHYRRRQMLEKRDHLFPAQSATQNGLFRRIHSMKLKNVLRRIHSNSGNLFHGRSPS